jgi:Co/Zn/Cd efflux system component
MILIEFPFPVEVQQPKLVLIVGAVGLCLNIISATFLHGKLSLLLSNLNNLMKMELRTCTRSRPFLHK